MFRRDLLVAILQALFLALFPWMRSARGLEAAKEGAERWLDDVYQVRVVGHYQLVCEAPGYNARVTF